MNTGGVLDFNLQILTGMLTLLGFVAIFFTLRNRSEEAELRRLLDKLHERINSPEQAIRRNREYKDWVENRESAINLLNEFMDTIRDNVRQTETNFHSYANKYQALIEEANYIGSAVKACKWLLASIAIISVICFKIAISGEETRLEYYGALGSIFLLFLVLFWIYKHLGSLFKLSDKYPSVEQLLNVEYAESNGLINTRLYYDTVGIYVKLMHDVGDKGPRKGFLISVILPLPFYNVTIAPSISYNLDEEYKRYSLKRRYIVPQDVEAIADIKETNKRTDVRIDFFHVVEGLQGIHVREMYPRLENLSINVRLEVKIEDEIQYNDFQIPASFLQHVSDPEKHPNIYWGTFTLYSIIKSLTERDSKKIFDRDTIEIDSLSN